MKPHFTFLALSLAGVTLLTVEVEAQNLLNFSDFYAIDGSAVARDPGGIAPFGDRPIVEDSLLFKNILPGVDGVVTAEVEGNYSHVGFYPNFRESNGDALPNNDLFFYHQSNASNAGWGGVTYTLRFFEANSYDDSSDSGVSAFVETSLYLYDLDGETGQSETARIYYSDGLIAYSTEPNGPTIDSSAADSVFFEGRAIDRDILDERGMVLLEFAGTSEIRFELRSNTTGANPYGAQIYTMIGSASIIPEPTAGVLLILAGVFASTRRRRA